MTLVECESQVYAREESQVRASYVGILTLDAGWIWIPGLRKYWIWWDASRMWISGPNERRNPGVGDEFEMCDGLSVWNFCACGNGCCGLTWWESYVCNMFLLLFIIRILLFFPKGFSQTHYLPSLFYLHFMFSPPLVVRHWSQVRDHSQMYKPS